MASDSCKVGGIALIASTFGNKIRKTKKKITNPKLVLATETGSLGQRRSLLLLFFFFPFFIFREFVSKLGKREIIFGPAAQAQSKLRG